MNKRITKIINAFCGKGYGSRESFRAKIDAKKSQISQWESGISKPSSEFRKRICTAYNISRDWLDTGQGQMQASAAPGAPQVANSGQDIERLKERAYHAEGALEELRRVHGALFRATNPQESWQILENYGKKIPIQISIIIHFPLINK